MTGSNGHQEPEPDAPPAHGRRDRRRPARGRRDPRSLATRVPVVLVLAAAVAGAVALDAGDDRADGAGASGADRATTTDAPVMPATPGAAAESSTWYCAAGTSEEGGFADHTVTIQNPTGDDLEATVTVYGGAVLAAAAAGAAPAAEPAAVPVVEQVALPAGERVAVRLADVMAAPLTAALVEVDGGRRRGRAPSVRRAR